MKTAEEYFDEYLLGIADIRIIDLDRVLDERDTEWKQKIQTALDKTSNWNCKEVLTKLLEDK